jgi:hypothetical protein
MQVRTARTRLPQMPTQRRTQQRVILSLSSYFSSFEKSVIESVRPADSELVCRALNGAEGITDSNGFAKPLLLAGRSTFAIVVPSQEKRVSPPS